MNLLHPSTAELRSLRSAFPTEWLGVGALVLVSLAWLSRSPVAFRASWQDGSVLLLIVAVFATTNWLGLKRTGLIAEYLALSGFATGVFAVISYLAFAASGPLVDKQLLAADRALGFDWLATLHWLWARPLLSQILLFAYNSYIFQGLYFGVLFGVMQRKTELREMFWLVFVAGIFTTAGALFFPALGPFHTFGLESYGAFLPDMERLHRGQNLSFALSELHGIVSFPSFHTSLALAYTYGFRRMGVIGVVIAGINIVMLFAIPFAGGHYLCDMIAGAAVMAASLGIVRAVTSWRTAVNAAKLEMQQGAVVL